MASGRKKKKPVAATKKSAMSKITGIRKRRQAAGKWTIGEKLTKSGRERAAARKRTKEGKKAIKAGERQLAGKKAKGTGLVSTKKSRAKAIGAKAGTKVRHKAVKKVTTKGGDYVKYEKGSGSAKKFQSAFKSGCAGGAKSFKWDGRSYSCAKAGPKKKKKPVTRGGAGGQSPE